MAGVCGEIVLQTVWINKKTSRIYLELLKLHYIYNVKRSCAKIGIGHKNHAYILCSNWQLINSSF